MPERAPDRTTALSFLHGPGRVATSAAAALLVAVGWLSWTFGRGWPGLGYLLVFVLATVPGWPLGIAWFGRRHAAAWVAGPLLGYGLTALTLWACILIGLHAPRWPVLGWALIAAIAWAVGDRARRPLIALPA